MSFYILYVDESGDPGILADGEGPRLGSTHYILSGLIVPIESWEENLKLILEEKRIVKDKFSIPIREECKGSELINPRGNKYLKIIPRFKRILIYSQYLKMIECKLKGVHILNTVYRKELFQENNIDIEAKSWEYLINRYNQFLKKNNAYGFIVSDDSNEPKIRKIVRKLRAYNLVPSKYDSKGYRADTKQIIEDPIFRDSKNSFYIQMADLIAHSLYRHLYPKVSYKRFNVDKLFEIIDSRLLKEASSKDSKGIVYVN